MRIACVIDRFVAGKGGLEVWLAALASRLAGGGHEITLLSADRTPPRGPWLHRPLPARGLTRGGRIRDFAERARVECLRSSFDVVLGLRHCLSCDVYAPHGGSVESTRAAHRRARRRPVPLLGRWRAFLALERSLLGGGAPPRLVIAVSESVRRDLAGRYPGVADRIRVVPNGVDLSRFRPGDREKARARLAPGGGGVVLFLAANPRLKGWRHAREAFRKLHREGAASTLLVAGGAPGRLPPGGRYLGFLERPEEVLRAADVLLQPTYHDPFPLATLEALACGTPVVTTEQNGALDHVGRDGPVRAVSDPADVDGLAAAARELLETAPREEARTRAEEFPRERSLAAAESLLTKEPYGGGSDL